MEKKQMVPCKHCGQEIAVGAKVCPHCGAKNKKPIFKKWWFWVIVVIIVGIAAAGSGSDSDTNKKTATSSAGQETVMESSHTEGADSKVSSGVTEIISSQTPEMSVAEEEDIPTEYKSALNKAKSYSDTMHMSKKGIYDQLTSEYGEQFSEEAAQYAMDHVDIDWNANALATAENYSNTMHMSKEGIYDQLISEYGEQFTEEEAKYAVDNLEADYKANALATAKNYQDMDMSPSAIYDQLISEYGEKFTKEEAQYAVDNLE